ncbi:ATP-binding protein [Hyphomicrobium sp. CS1BSMeth3]|uniref:ATP-binding protein n=1 Tax=Hyphomicrobium sp. CS1BSMeth3 TaxID=1892844 RepID=UPI0009F9D6C7|nr:ATP-binding protein [Hyphomicrobium sp. CS1BSMeth3]
MRRFVDSIKGRVVIAFVVFVALSYMGGLWLYSVRSEAAIDLLHDTLVADRIALLTRAAEARSKKSDFVVEAVKRDGLSGVVVTSDGNTTNDANRADLLQHLVGAFLNRENDRGIVVTFLRHKSTPGTDSTIGFINAAAHLGEHHRVYTPISEIKHEGTIVASVTLADGSTLKMAVPAMTATSFSLSNLGSAIAAVVFFAIVAAIWVLNRWTQPLVHFAAAADRLGADIRAPSLVVEGLYEVRTAAKAFNRMQEQILRLVDDRSAMAAAIAHDLGTPVTRLRLRAEEIEDPTIKERVLDDIEQMQRMMTSTLEYSRLGSDSSHSEIFDLASLADAVCSEFMDLGGNVTLTAPPRLSVVSDPVSIRRILANLVDNAVRYAGAVCVEIRSSKSSVTILVDDNGPGIPPEFRATALAPFRRLSTSDGSNARGTGLGLAIAHHLVVRLGGKMELRDSLFGGLRVALSFPQHAQQQGAERQRVGT